MPASFDALRAEIWRAAADDQLTEGALIDRLLALLGPSLAARRALYFDAPAEGEAPAPAGCLRCSHEWRAPRLSPLLGLTLPPEAAGPLLTPSARRLPAGAPGALAEAAGPLAGSALLVLPFPVNDRLEGTVVLTHRRPRRWTARARAIAGEAVSVIAAAVARRRAEAAKRQAELRHRIIAELCSDFAFAVTFGPDGTPAMEWSTIRPEQVADRNPPTFENLLRHVRAEHRDRILDALQRSRRNEATTLVFEATTRYGEQRFFQVEHRPVWDAVTGRVARVFGLGRNITDRVLTERELRRDRDLLRSMLEASPHGVVMASLESVIVDCNGAALRAVGCTSREEVIGRSVLDFCHEADRARARELRELARAGRPVRGARLRGLAADGHPFPLQLTIGLVRTPEGKPWGFLEVLENVADQEETETRLLQAHKAQSLAMLAEGLAADLDGLLRAALSHAERGRGLFPPDTPGHREAQHVVAALSRVSGLAHQLLEYAGKGSFKPEPVDLSALVAEAARGLGCELPPAVRLELELARSLPPLVADPRQIRQAASNLVRNAAEAIGERAGAVVVRTAARRFDAAALARATFGAGLPEGEYLVLEVSDDGCGMGPATLAQIFDPFFTTKGPGRGLGLPMVQGTVRAHRGALSVESEPGAGSTFRVLLPAAPPSSLALSRP